MEAVRKDGAWETRAVTTGEVLETYRARDLLRAIAEGTHVCGDPGVQYDTTINRWHTCPNSARINASNPCSEYMFVDDSACNLASLNLLTFLGDDGQFDGVRFQRSVELIITAINKRDNPVKEVILTPHGDNVEFVPQSYFLGSLAAETSQDIVFSVKPLGTGPRDISFDLSYKNGDNLHTNSLVVPLTVIDALDVAPIITNFPISITKGGSARISIEVYNAKTEKITGVLITPVCNTTIIPSQYFIGSMDPDDVFSASFDIYADMIDYGSHFVGFIVSFKQGNDYYETPIVTKAFSVVQGPGVSYQASGGSTSSSESNGMPFTSSLLTCLTPVIIVIVVAILFVLFYIRWKKRRQA